MSSSFCTSNIAAVPIPDARSSTTSLSFSFDDVGGIGDFFTKLEGGRDCLTSCVAPFSSAALLCSDSLTSSTHWAIALTWKEQMVRNITPERSYNLTKGFNFETWVHKLFRRTFQDERSSHVKLNYLRLKIIFTHISIPVIEYQNDHRISRISSIKKPKETTANK